MHRKLKSVKVVSPYVYTVQELAKHLRVNYKTMLKIVATENMRPFIGARRGFRFSYFQLPKWIKDTLPVPTVTYES